MHVGARACIYLGWLASTWYRQPTELNRDAKWSFQIVIESAQALQASHRFADAPPLFTAYHTWRFLHGNLTLNLNHALPRESEQSLAERLDRQVDLLNHGLSNSPTPPKILLCLEYFINKP